MYRRKLEMASVFMLVILLVFGCASVNYVGNSFDPTTSIDIYYSKDEIMKEYTVIGHAIGLGVVVSSEKIHAKLIESAKLKGADALLISGIGKSEVLLGTGVAAGEKQIYASFLKYK